MKAERMKNGSLSKEAAEAQEAKYTHGTLHYTKAGLVGLFGWMIMGNLCFGLFEGNGGAGSIPFYLQDNFHISNTMVSVLFNLIPMLIGTFMTPIVSFWSDRTRSRLGRRIPYILFTAPFLVLFAIALGFSDDIIALCKVRFATSPTIAPLGAALFVIGFLVIGWSFFNEFVGTVYYYLLPDVMPRHFLGRFQGMSQAAGTLLGMGMNIWVLPHQLTHIKAIHVGVAILYFVGLGLVCWRVKEGQYPPVEDVTEKTTFMDKTRLYFKECFNHPIYIMIYMVTAVSVLARGLNPAGIFSLHMRQHVATIAAHANTHNALAATSSGDWMVSGGQDGMIRVFQGPDNAFRVICALKTNSVHPSCMAVSSLNADLVALAMPNGKIELWDTTRKIRLQTFNGHSSGVACMTIAGSQLVSAGLDHTLCFWNVQTNTCAKKTTIPNEVGALGATPNGKWAVLATGSKTVTCWDVDKSEASKTFTLQTDCAHGVAITQDGKMVATCSSNGTLEVWDVLEKPTLKHVIQAGDKVHGFGISGDGRDVFACIGQDIQIWDVSSEAKTIMFRIPIDAPHQLSISPDGKRCVVETQSGIQVCQQPEKMFKLTQVLGRQSGDPISALVVNQTGRLIALSTTHGSIELWNIAQDAGMIRKWSTGDGAASCLACSETGNALVSAGTDQVIRVWDTTAGRQLQSLPVSGQVTALAMTPDGNRVAVGFEKGDIQCWDIGSNQTQRASFSRHGGAVDALVFSETGKTLASHSQKGTIEIWAVTDDARPILDPYQRFWCALTQNSTIPSRVSHFNSEGAIRSLAFSENGSHLAIYSDRSVKHWSVTANKSVNLVNIQAASTSIAMTPDSARMISGGQDGTLTLWDNANIKDPVLLKTLKPHSGAPLAVDFSNDGRTAAAGSLDGTIDLWDTATGQCSLTLTGHTAFVRGVVFSPDGKRLASASADKTIRIWDTRTGACQKILTGHDDDVNCVAFSSRGDRLVSGGNDKKILVWDVASGKVVQQMEGSPGPIYAVCFAPAIEAIPDENRPKEEWFIATARTVGTYLKNVFVNESLFAVPASQISRIVAEDRWIVSGGRDGETDEVNSGVRIWDIETGKLIPAVEALKTKAMKGHKKAIVSVMYKPDLRVIVSASLDESIRVWQPLDLTTELTRKADDQSFRSFSGYTHDVTGLAIQRTGKIMINASIDGTLHAWDIDQGISLTKSSRFRGVFFQIITLLLAYPLGALIDRMNPIRITLWATFLTLPTSLLYFFFYQSYASGLWIDLSMLPVNMLLGMSAVPMMVMLYPKTKYGQFCSANAMVKQSVSAVAGILGAVLMDQMTAFSYETDNYRYGYLFRFVVNVISFLCLTGVYFHWKKIGGGKGYVAPEADGKHLTREPSVCENRT